MRYCSLILMEHAVLPHVSALTQPPAKFLVIDYENKTPLETFRQWVLEEYPQQLDAFFSCQAYLEIIPRGLSKGNTLAQLAQRLGIPIENTVAAGDAANDLSTLRAAGIGVAMCHGPAEANAAAAAASCRDNQHAGTAEIIIGDLVHR